MKRVSCTYRGTENVGYHAVVISESHIRYCNHSCHARAVLQFMTSCSRGKAFVRFAHAFAYVFMCAGWLCVRVLDLASNMLFALQLPALSWTHYVIVALTMRHSVNASAARLTALQPAVKRRGIQQTLITSTDS